MTDVATLLELANQRGIELDEDAAAFLVKSRGLAAAEDLVAGAGALIDLASALGQDLAQVTAFRKMDAADGDYQLAASRILEPFRRHRQHVFTSEWGRLERKLYDGDAKARHAVFVGHLAGGSLGWQASMLLRAAEDAGLQRPGPAEYRARLVRVVGDEIERRFPVRRESEWQVIGEDNQAHSELIRGEIVREQQARDLVLGKRPELAQRIDALTSKRLIRDVNAVLRKIRTRLASCAEKGWKADPERYEREVIAGAQDAARRAS